MMPSHCRLSAAISMAAIVAAGCLASLFIAIKVSPHVAYLRQKTDIDITDERRRLLLPDPKTVQLRPKVNSFATNDVNIINEIGAPRGADPNHQALMFDASAKVVGPPQLARATNVDFTSNLNANTQTQNNNANAIVAPYTLESAINTVRAFRYTLFFFVYDSASDEFIIIHNIPGCDHGCHRIFRLASVTAYALRKNFPDRIKQHPDGENDFVVMMSCGDAPRISVRCLNPKTKHCGSADFGPILQFGSVFVDTAILPTMIAMPLPVRPHIPCFDEWQVNINNFGNSDVCQDLKPKIDFTSSEIKTGLVFGQELGMNLANENYWEELIPQIIWRGTDFVFLHTLFQQMRAPEYKLDIEPKEKELDNGSPLNEEDRKRWTIDTLWQMGDAQLLPRWRGVLLTSEAELDAERQVKETGAPALPWINIKFASINREGQKISAAQNEEYQILQKMGISVIGEHVNMTEQAKYRYHIDLGGGGGTTWTGTIEKLALPGLLFHHMTPTKDWFHDLLVPWEHYVPVKTDLSDLREKFEWAESNPAEARRIAENGTNFARWMGSPEGFAQLYNQFMINPLRNVLDAYQPLKMKWAPQYAHMKKSVLEVITEQREERGFTVVGKCSGLHSNSCAQLV